MNQFGTETDQDHAENRVPPRLQPNVAFIGGNRTPMSAVRYGWDEAILVLGRSRSMILLSMFWSVLWGPPVLYILLMVYHIFTIEWSVCGVIICAPFLFTGIIATLILIGLLFSQSQVQIDFFRGSVVFRHRFYRSWREEFELADVDSFYLHDTTRRSDMYLGPAALDITPPGPRLGGNPDQSADSRYRQVWCLQMKFKTGREIRIFQTTNTKIAKEIMDIISGHMKPPSASC